MKKFILAFIFISSAILFLGKNNDVLAAPHTDYMKATLDNSIGTIPITVSYYFSKHQLINGIETGINTNFGQGSSSLATGARLSNAILASTSHDPSVEGGANYYMIWWTNCTDPSIPWKGFELDSGTGNFTYDFKSQDVVCRTTNGEPAITSISCPNPGTTLSFSWEMTGGGPYNVGSYYVYWSQAPDANPDGDNTTGPLPSTQTSISLGSKTPGQTYYVRVSAVSPQGEFSSPAYSSSPCQSLVVPPAPTSLIVTNVPACSDTNYGGTSDNGGNSPNIKLNFNVTSATSAQLELYKDGALTAGTPFNWSLNSSNNYTLSAWFWNLSPEANYTWRVRVGNSVGWGDWVSGTSWNVPYCPVNISGKKVNASGVEADPGGATITIKDSSGAIIASYDAGVTSFNKTALRPNVNYTVSSTIPSGYAVTSSLCASCTAHSSSSYTGNYSQSFTILVGGYADIYFKYSFPSPTNLTTTPSVSCTDTTYLATFSWTLPAGITKVDFELRNWTTGALITSSSWLSAVTSTSNSSLSPGIYYYFKVRAGNSNGFSDWTISSPFNLPTCTKPDLIVSSVTTSKSTYILGVDTTVDVTIQIKNQGGGPVTENGFFTVYSAEPAKSASTLDACALQLSSKVNSSWKQELPYGPGATTTYTHSFSVPATAGTYLIRSIVDWGCFNNNETDEANNTKDITYQVQQSKFDLSASFVGGSWNKQSFQANETATATVTLTNISPPANITGPATTLGLWKGQLGEVPIANCPSSPQSTPPVAYTKDKNNNNIGVLPPGNIQEVNISFNVGNNPGTFTSNVYVIPSCTTALGADSDWTNNSSAAGVNISFTYSVRVDAWFETVGGDVGSGGNVALGFDNPPRPQSSYVLARSASDTNAKSQKWTLNNYGKPLATAPVYEYLADRFLEKAKTAKAWKSGTIPSGDMSGFNYYDNDATNISGGAPNGNPSIIFIKGNLGIDYDLTLASGDSAIFIVSGNITVKTGVTRIDGIYVAGGSFRDTTDDSTLTGNQLVINGAVYASTMNLNRKLSSTATCAYPTSHSCTNSTDPAEVVLYDPKYLVFLNTLIASPQVSWREIAP